MKTFARSDRVSGQIQKALSDLLHKGTKDPRLDMVTVTGVKTTQDLKVAYVYFTTSGGSKSQTDAKKGFESASGFLRRTLAKNLGLRYMPDLRFVHDESFDYGSRIDSLLKSIEDEKSSGDDSAS